MNDKFAGRVPHLSRFPKGGVSQTPDVTPVTAREL